MSEWKTIDTMPVGRVVLGWSIHFDHPSPMIRRGKNSVRYCYFVYVGLDIESRYGGYETGEPTHWMELPEPPVVTE